MNNNKKLHSIALWCFLLLLSNNYSLASEKNDDGRVSAILWTHLDELHADSQSNETFSAKTVFGIYGSYDDKTCQVDYQASVVNDDVCIDSRDDCEDLASRGECLLYAEDCPKACLVCKQSLASKFKIGVSQGISSDVFDEAYETAANIGLTDFVIDLSLEDLIKETATIVFDTHEYMKNTVMKEEDYKLVRRSCQNYDSLCSEYAALGYCDPDFLEGSDFIWMMVHCSPACQRCDDYEMIQPCEVNFQFNIFQEGDIDVMFRNIVGESQDSQPDYLPYKPIILSRPGGDSDDASIHDGPWIVTLENFLSNEECDRLIQLGKERGYSRSTFIEGEGEGKKEDYRTSVNSWCTGECADDPVGKNIVERISRTTGIPSSFQESLQMLQYMPNQYYKTHHDVDEADWNRPSGPRLLTFFLYLNDVKEGGATRMVDLHADDVGEENKDEDYVPTPIEILPKKGAALIWPNLDNDDLYQKEEGTWHEALPVIQGMKYAANAWFRTRNNQIDCEVEAYNEWRAEHNIEPIEEESDSNDED